MIIKFQISQPKREQASFSAKKGKRATRIKATIPRMMWNFAATAMPTEKVY